MTLLSIPGISTITSPASTEAIAPSSDSRVIYISNAGDDANNTDGYSIGVTINDSHSTPLATVAKGLTYLRDGYPDWLVLKKGDSWVEVLGQWKISGRSASEPMVVNSYGAGTTRPLLKCGANSLLSTSGSGGGPDSTDYLVFKGFEAYAHTRDPDGVDFVDTSGSIGVYWLRGANYLTIEDCKISFFKLGMSIDDFDAKLIQNVTIKKNVIVDSYDTAAHSQGIYMDNVTSCTIDENIFDHNGWHATQSGAGRTAFNHGIYLQSDNVLNAINVTNNIIMRSSSHGVQHRSGGQLTGNLVVENAIALLMGANASYHPTPVVIGYVNDNVILNSDDIDGGNPRGWGIDAEQTISPTEIHDNILAHVYGTNVSGIDVKSPGVASESGNIIEDWGAYDTGSPEDYVDSTVEIEDYSTSVGGAGTRADFFAQCRLQSEDTWDTDYAVANIRQYFIDNFALV